MSYDPVTGAGYDQDLARRLFGMSAHRGLPAWQLRGEIGSFYWTYFNFKSFEGRLTIESDGFHWQTTSYDTGELLHSGVTTSLYEAYQSIVQNRPVSVRELERE